jgi:iron(III) transport system permease protein
LRSAAPFVGLAALAAALAVLPLAGIAGSAAGGDAETLLHILRYVLPRSLADTLLLLFGVALVTGIVGTLTAYLVTMYRFPGRNSLLVLLPLPLAIPTYIVAYIYVDFLGPFGPAQLLMRAVMGAPSASNFWFPEIRSLGGAVVVIGLVLYPYVYLGMRAMFQTQSGLLLGAARVHGATRWAALRKVMLPLARPALAAGISLALLETLNDIGASEYLGVQTLTLSIFTTWLNRGSLAGAAQISCFVLAIVAGLIAIERYGRRNTVTEFAAESPRLRSRVMLKGTRGWWALAADCCPWSSAFSFPSHS